MIKAFDHKTYWKLNCSKYSVPDSEISNIFVSSKINYILNFIKIDKDTSILDVGCATGLFTFYFLKLTNKVIGVDFSQQLIQKSPCKQNLVCADAFLLPFKNKAFDIVFSSCLLHHLCNRGAAVKELARVSKKYVILCEPNRNNPAMFLFSIIFRHERAGLRFSKAYLKKLISSHCDKLLRIDTMGTVTPNRMPLVIVRLLKPFDKCSKLGLYTMAIAQVC